MPASVNYSFERRTSSGVRSNVLEQVPVFVTALRASKLVKECQTSQSAQDYTCLSRRTCFVIIPPTTAGVRQLAALFILFKGVSSSGGLGVCPPENV